MQKVAVPIRHFVARKGCRVDSLAYGMYAYFGKDVRFQAMPSQNEILLGWEVYCLDILGKKVTVHGAHLDRLVDLGFLYELP